MSDLIVRIEGFGSMQGMSATQKFVKVTKTQIVCQSLVDPKVFHKYRRWNRTSFVFNPYKDYSGFKISEDSCNKIENYVIVHGDVWK